MRCLSRLARLSGLRRLSQETPAQHRAFLLIIVLAAAELLLIAAALAFVWAA